MDIPEQYRLRAVFASRQLGEDDAGDETLDEDACHRLDHDEKDGGVTAAGDGARPVADRVLRLDGEQQGGDEVVDAVDAGGPRVIVHVVDVAMTPADDVPATTQGRVSRVCYGSVFTVANILR